MFEWVPWIECVDEGYLMGSIVGLTEEQKNKFSFAESQFVMDEYDERMEMINRFMDQVSPPPPLPLIVQ